MNFRNGKPAGRLVITAGAEALAEKVDVSPLVRRHLSMDWGDVCDEDKAANDRSILASGGAHSAYNTPHGTIWIITDPGGEVTTILLPDEY